MKQAFLGSYEKFDLRHLPYSIRGSSMCVLEDPEDRRLYLSLTRSPGIGLERKNLVNIAPVLDGKELPFTYCASPDKLTIRAFKGSLEICFAGEQQMRVRGSGIGLRFSFKMQMFENASPTEGGDWEVAWILLGKLLFAPLSGSLWCGARWAPEIAKAEDFSLELIPSTETGKFEAALHEYYSNGGRDESYRPFDECAAESARAFEAFFKDCPKSPEKYRQMARLAAYAVWSHYMRPQGRIKNPVVFMSRTSLIRAFGWQQSFQAMALGKNAREAWRLLLVMFDYQDESGQIPDSVGEMGVSYLAPKPAIEGFALQYLADNFPLAEISEKDCAELYSKLSKSAKWWLAKRDRIGSGIPHYYHSDESGWDDASIFKEGLPLESGDLLAYLILLADALGKLALKAGAYEEISVWAAQSQRLMDILLAQFWNGRKFASRLAQTGEIVETGSVVALLPIILGKRLPSHIIEAIASRLADDEEFMTPGGIASESLKSPHFTARDGFMLGNVVAPVQTLLAIGLKNAGKEELACEIATRYCDFACEKGLSLTLPPFDYDLSSGQSVKKEERYKPEDRKAKADRFKDEKREAQTVEPWTSWAAANFLVLMNMAKS
jgi:hypothetical protein